MELIKNTKLPSERALAAIKTWEKETSLTLTPKEKAELSKIIIEQLQDAIMEDRYNNDKFIELSTHENGVLDYYLGLLDKMKYMVGEIILENSRKKRDALLIETAKILGANVVAEEIPHNIKLKQAI
jgi:hypothetical protein